MTQYRLLDKTVDVIEATDEYWDAASRNWIVVHRSFVGERFYAVIPYRRAMPDPEVNPTTKKIVLREYLERYGDTYRIEWRTVDESGFAERHFIMPDEAIATGQEREIEIPV